MISPLLTLTFNGKQLKFQPRDEADRSVIAEIFNWREYRPAEEIIKNAETIIDAGAHLGAFTIYCRALNPETKIFCLEPEPKNYVWLKRHLSENKITAADLTPMALAGQTGERFLAVSPDSHNHKLVDEKNNQTVKVNTVSLADFCAKKQIRSVSLLKMDIEGAEFEVLKNLKPADFAIIKNIILEYHNNEERHCRQLEKILQSSGFRTKTLPSSFDRSLGFILAIGLPKK